MLLVYLLDPEPGCEEELRLALRSLPATTHLQPAGRRWLLRIDADELKSVREAILGLKRRYPCLASVRPFG